MKVFSPTTNTSILSGLSASERSFAEPLVAMGFGEEDVIRSMQKCDKDQKEVRLKKYYQWSGNYFWTGVKTESAKFGNAK